ncbi:MAG: serine/threonine protein kinase [Planctomycetota bacterium]|nr:MAG: serine/threonine protein kinase [Planctomycetota bacterium]
MWIARTTRLVRIPAYQAACTVWCCWLAATPAGAGDWPGFRGPRHDGTASDSHAPVHWSATENVRWKAPLPRPANGSPVVAAGRVWVTSAEDPRGMRRSLYCLDRETGATRWVATVDFGREMPTHKTNPYCGTTPVVSDGRVVVWHGSAGLYCYDLDGNELWHRDLGEFRHIWGYGSSPIVHDGVVLLNSGPGLRVFAIALRLEDGQTVWQRDEPVTGDGSRNAAGAYTGSWSTPIVARVGGRDIAIFAMPTRLVAYAVDSGDEVWSCGGVNHPKGDLAYASPTLVDGICFYTGGFGGPMLSVLVDGRGDVTETKRLFRIEKQPQAIGSPVAVEGAIYRPNAGPGTIECIDPKTGRVRWVSRGAGGNMWASLVRAGDLLYATNQQGTTVVFRANPEKYEEVARNQLEDGCNATPAISDGNVFVRTDRFVWCIGE